MTSVTVLANGISTLCYSHNTDNCIIADLVSKCRSHKTLLHRIILYILLTMCMNTGLSTVCLSDENAAYSTVYFKVKYRLHEDVYTYVQLQYHSKHTSHHEHQDRAILSFSPVSNTLSNKLSSLNTLPLPHSMHSLAHFLPRTFFLIVTFLSCQNTILTYHQSPKYSIRFEVLTAVTAKSCGATQSGGH